MNRFTDVEFDSALSADNDSILPSSGFTTFVMSTVHSEASASPPIAFPWRRALPGFIAYIAVIGVLIATCIYGVRATDTPAAKDLLWPILRILTSQDGSSTGMLWLALSMLIALLCLAFTQRLGKLR